MKVTTQQKVLLGFLGVGIVLLSYDQLHATPVPAGEQEEVVVQRSGSPTEAIPTPTLSAAARLNQLQKSSPRDAFATLATPAPAVETISASEFAGKYHLTAVMLSGAQAKAMINGSLVHIGQTVDGYTLVSLDRASAVLRSGTHRLVLHID